MGEIGGPKDTVDQYIETWTPEQIRQLDAWRQGLLVPCDAIVWLTANEEHPGELQGAAAAGIGTGFAAITSQTCDIVATGPGQRHPYVQVSPVRDVSYLSDNALRDVKLGAAHQFVYLTKPPVPDGNWAVDLRISVPLLKSALLNTAPTVGFASEADEIGFAERVAAKLLRPAFHDEVVATNKELGIVIANAKKKDNRVFDRVEQIRIEVLRGTALNPKSFRYVAITDRKPDVELVPKLIDFKKAQSRRLTKAGISMATPIAVAITKMKVKDYRDYIPVFLPMLERGYF